MNPYSSSNPTPSTRRGFYFARWLKLLAGTAFAVYLLAVAFGQLEFRRVRTTRVGKQHPYRALAGEEIGKRVERAIERFEVVAVQPPM